MDVAVPVARDEPAALSRVQGQWRGVANCLRTGVMLRTKTLFDLMKRPPTAEEVVVTAFRDGEVTLRSNRRTDGFTNSIQEIGYQGVRRGDLVIHAMDAFCWSHWRIRFGRKVHAFLFCLQAKRGLVAFRILWTSTPLYGAKWVY